MSAERVAVGASPQPAEEREFRRILDQKHLSEGDLRMLSALAYTVLNELDRLRVGASGTPDSAREREAQFMFHLADAMDAGTISVENFAEGVRKYARATRLGASGTTPADDARVEVTEYSETKAGLRAHIAKYWKDLGPNQKIKLSLPRWLWAKLLQATPRGTTPEPTDAAHDPNEPRPGLGGLTWGETSGYSSRRVPPAQDTTP